MIPPLWLLWAVCYLLIVVPISFGAATCVFLFAAIFPDARRSTRGMCLCFLLLSIAHFFLKRFLFGASPDTALTGFDYFWEIALLASPFIWLIAAVLPPPRNPATTATPP